MTAPFPILGVLAALATPAPLEDVGVVEHLGASIPGDLKLTDQAGDEHRLDQLTTGTRPVILVLAYYRCPMLCGLVLNGVAKTVREFGGRPGQDFDLLTISFDPTEGPADADRRRTSILSGFGDPEASWPFLVADEDSVNRLLATAGVGVKRDPNTGQYAHPAVFMVLTPDRRISRYLYGFDVRPFDLKLALAEAGKGKTGPSFAKLLLRCFSYDPSTRRYGVAIATAYRIGGVVLLLGIGGVLGLLFIRERRRGSA